MDLQSTCKVCGREEKFDFHVPDEVWEGIVPKEFQNHVVCLGCFDDFAFRAGWQYGIRILYFAGRAATFTFKAIARAIVDETELRRKHVL